MLNATHGTGAYTEKVTSYDKNGKIKALQRYGNGLIDDLTYTYSGNQLTRVDDATGSSAGFSNGASTTNEYVYDNNGNLTKDSNKGITSIAYNCLNLPSKVTFTDGSTITYSYAADGTKQRTMHTISGTTTQKDYCANVVYENGVQKMLLTEEGYVDLSASTSTYYYYLKDHQGNNRVVINSSGTVAETNHYYPFGSLFASTSVQPYKYNGKELDTKKGLNWYDYGARHYDAMLGRWLVVDPLAEKYISISPYSYCLSNPILLIDKNGEEPGPGDLFYTIRDAAKDWGMYYNGASILQKREMASSIYAKNGKYSYTNAQTLGEHSGKITTVPNTVATIHSHGEYTGFISKGGVSYKVEDNLFSKADITTSERIGLTGYLATPNGSLLEYNPENQKVELVSTNLPSDPNDPSRLNEIPPIDNTRSFWDKFVDFFTNLF